MLLLLVLFLLSFVLVFIGKRKSGASIFILAITLFFFIGSGVLPFLLTYYLQKSQGQENINWDKHMIIVVLGGGTVVSPKTNAVKPAILAYARIYEAAHQYFVCKEKYSFCKIIISGGAYKNFGKSEAVVYKNALLGLAVNKTDIILESNSKNTFENAKFSAHILKKMHSEKIVLVTSAMHMKRAKLYFSYFGVQTFAVMSDYIAPVLSIIPISFNYTVTDMALHEYAGIAQFYLYNFFKINKK